MKEGEIVRLSGPTVHAVGLEGRFMHEVVSLGREHLMGEIIRIEGDRAVIQVYEETTGLAVGDPVERSGRLLSVELGPGLLSSIYDGIQRPLPLLREKWGDFVRRGARVTSLDRERHWPFSPLVEKGEFVSGGMVLGLVEESSEFKHKIMVPPLIEGEVEEIEEGEFTVSEPVVRLKGGREISMLQRWNIREGRPYGCRLPFNVPFVTGQRILDTLFPVAKGGSAVIPGGFGTGKTVLEQTIAKFADAQIIIYVGCGERGNEMADVLHQFPRLKDPYGDRPLMERTILIANTSNMPVAAREASIYTGVTIAEYYRDMGYAVALLADSTSRWAEALREISSRLEEMPGEEGYPPYLSSRLGAFYERAGRVKCLGREEEGSVTIIGAVSPPGGDFSEPVTQASMRMASSFWSLDYDLAHQRHFPAINWLSSFTLSEESLRPWFGKHLSPLWKEKVERVNTLLQKEEELIEVVKVIGLDAMGDRERVHLEEARILREGFLRQSSYHPVDGFCSLQRQEKILSLLLFFLDRMEEAANERVALEKILQAPMVESLLRFKEVAEEESPGEEERIRKAIKEYFA